MSTGNIIGLAALFISSWLGLSAILNSNLTDFNTRNKWADWIENQPILSIHKKLLTILLSKLDNFYGPNLSKNALGVSVALALLYPPMCLLFAYSYLGGSDGFGGIELISKDTAISDWAVFPFTIFLSGAGYVLLRRLCRAPEFSDIFVVAFMVVVVVKLDVAAGIVTLVAGASVIASVIGIGIGIGIALVLINVVLAVCLLAFYIPAVLGVDNIVSILTFLFLFLGLSLLNGIMDWISWGVSRYFLEKISNATIRWKIAFDVVIDAFVAAVCLVLLCIFLMVAAELANQFIGTDIDIDTIVQTTYKDPWGEGFMTSMMLVSTLIPTLIHIVLGFTAAFIHFSPSTSLVGWLRVDDPEKATNTGPMAASLWLAAILFIITPVVIYVLYLLYTWLPLGEWLYSTGCWFAGVGCSM